MEDVSTTMYELAERLKNLKAEKSETEDYVKTLNAEIADTEQQLVSLMTQTETQNFTRAGTMFSLVNKTRASAVADRKADLYAALKENGYGDLVYETVNANTLSSFVKDQIDGNEDALPKWLDGLVNVNQQPGVSVRKSNRKTK